MTLDAAGHLPSTGCAVSMRPIVTAHMKAVLRELIHLFKYAGIQTAGASVERISWRRRCRAICRSMPSLRCLCTGGARWQRLQSIEFAGAQFVAPHRITRQCCALLRGAARTTQVQAGLSNTNRRRNVAAAFHCRKCEIRGWKTHFVSGRCDDHGLDRGILCAMALKRAGAVRVSLLTAARVDRRGCLTCEVRGETSRS